MKIERSVLLLAMVATSGSAFAGAVVNPAPEPETLALIAIGAAAIAVARWIKRK